MKLKIKLFKVLLLIISINLLVGCKTNTKKAFDINSTNTDMKNSVGFDLLKYKARVDNAFPADSFYLNLCKDILFNSGKSVIFNKFGAFRTYDSGVVIRSEECDSLFVKIANCIADNIYLQNFQKISKTTDFCQQKIKFQRNLKSINGVVLISATSSFGTIYDANKT